MQALIRWSWVLGLVGVLALLGAAATAFVLDTREGAPTWFLIGGAVALLSYAAVDRERLTGTFQSRAFLYGSGSSLIVALGAAIAVAGYLIAREHDQTWDLTEDRQFSLSDHTRQVVAGIDQDVTILAFHRHDSEEQRRFRDLIRQYEALSPRLTVEYVDPLRNPRLAEQHEVTGDHGILVLTRPDGASRRIETAPSEDKLTGALVTLLADEEHVICWSVGHGEPDPDDEYADRGAGVVVTELEQLNYQVSRTTVATTGIERTCEALVVVRPQTEWLPFEREALAAFLAEGGRALVLLDVALTPELAADLARYGLAVGDDIVLDFNPQNQMFGIDDPSVLVLSGRNIVRHPMTRNLSAALILEMARSVSPLEGRPEGLVVDVLLRASEQSWGETSTDTLQVQPDGEEIVGEVAVAAAVEIQDPAAIEVAQPSGAPPSDAGPLSADPARGVPSDFAPKPGGRLVVVGDSDFANNVYVAFGNNRDLFLNAIAWLVDEDDQIGERPEPGDTLEITAMGEALLCLVSVFVVPGAAVALAAATLLRRRFL